jgi:glycerophosphoryl diester phosphodiesterase
MLRRLSATALTGCTVLTLAGPAPAEAAATPLVIGHRGQVVPGTVENTLPAFRAALATADYVETDVQWSKDGWAMILHDPTLDRTTDCTGLLVRTTGSKARACGLVTMGAFLRFMQTRTGQVVLELKAPGTTAKQARGVLSELAKYGLTSRVVVSSGYNANLRTLRAQPGGTKVRVAMIDATVLHTASQVKAAGSSVMALWLGTATAARVKAYHAGGVKVWVWTADSEADYRRAVDIGADGIIANDPAAARRFLEARR